MLSQPPRILIVDDEPELLEIFNAWVTGTGYETRTAANGADAIEILRREPVDVLISDIRMPIMDGVTMLRRIHALGLTVPSIILVSGFGHVERREIHALGVERLLEKPVRRQHLVSALQVSLQNISDRWAQAPGQTPPKAIIAEVPGVARSTPSGCSFLLGRGGCCVPAANDVREGLAIHLNLKLAKDRVELRGQGDVQWLHEPCGCAGVSFQYLEPGSRDWVVRWIEQEQPLSYIPLCEAAQAEIERQRRSERQLDPVRPLLRTRAR